MVLHVADLSENLIDHQSQPCEIFAHFRLFDLEGQVVVLLEDESGLRLRRKYSVEGALYVLVHSHYQIVLGFGKLKNFSQNLLMVQHSQLLLPDLMKQPEIAVRSKADERAHFVADIFDCVILGNLQLNWLAFN